MAIHLPSEAMNKARVAALCVALGLAAASCRDPAPPAPAATTSAVPHGMVRGSVRVTGTPAPNPDIWMRNDPMCQPSGAAPVQEAVVTGADGRLANVFVQLTGAFPETPVPSEPVLIDQRGCLYRPRVVGLRVGQPLRVSNSDHGVHNVHGLSTGNDGFNVAQPAAGMHNDFKLKTEGVLRIVCDLHPWMVAFVGVVPHPYFAVTGADGSFEIRDVPAGLHRLQAWHEQLGVLTADVRVEPGAPAAVEFVYAAKGKD